MKTKIKLLFIVAAVLMLGTLGGCAKKIPPKHDFSNTGDMSIKGLEDRLDKKDLVGKASIIVQGYFMEDVEPGDDPEMGSKFNVYKFKVTQAHKGQYLPLEGYVQYVSSSEFPPAGLEFGEECILFMDYYWRYNDIPVYGLVSLSSGVFYADGNWGYENVIGEKFTEYENYLPKYPK